MKDRMPEAKLIIVTRWAPVSNFKRYVEDPLQVCEYELLCPERYLYF